MVGNTQEPNTEILAGADVTHGSALLSHVVLEVSSRLEGRAQASIMADLMDVTPQLARRQNGVPRRARRVAHATAHAEVWLRGRLVRAGLTDVEARLLMVKRPAGVLEGLLYWMFCASPLAPATHEAILELQALDAQLTTLLVERDVGAMLKWLRDEADLRPHLFDFVDVAGCPPLLQADLAPLEELSVRLKHLTVNMLLSLLAVIDHEVTPRIATDQWSGCSFVAALLAPEDEPGVCSPIALMVDLVLAVGLASLDGAFPAERPRALDVERRLAGRKSTASTTARGINSLRRRERQFDRRALRTLMLDTKLYPAGVGQSVVDEAEMLMPMLAAAHLLTAMMPTRSGRKAHPCRRGWRTAYLHWWHRQAEARGLPRAPTGTSGPPTWFTFT